MDQDLQHARVRELIESQQHLSQSEIASRANIPAQALSDLKNGHRSLSELAARRLGETFGVSYQWLLGNPVPREPPTLSSASIATSEGTVWLPQFEHPIQGEPRTHPKYIGSEVEVTGAAAVRASMAVKPYVLKFGAKDVQGRLLKDDLILISQEVSDHAKIFVIKLGRKLVLARRSDETFVRLADGKTPRGPCVEVGHCVGVVWAALH